MNKHNLKITSQNSVFILIEFQKTWTKKGIFHKLIKKEYESRNVLLNTINLLEKARKNDIKVIHAPLIIDKKNKFQYKKMPFLPKLLKRFTYGTWKAEFTKGVFYPNDKVVKGRFAFDATKGSNLEEILIEGNYENLFFCGFTTDHCVSDTMESLIKKKYNCMLVSDCTATMSHSKQVDVEKKYNTMLSQEIIKFI
jgi:nicotinamidase-related amidase